MHNREKGRIGEEIAKTYLEKKGYSVVTLNYHKRGGEVDIIARDGETVVFVEVKARRDASYGYPSEAVDAKKQRRIRETALAFLGDRALDTAMRFDVIEIYMDMQRINHIKNAF